jgi:hypothetical protein
MTIGHRGTLEPLLLRGAALSVAAGTIGFLFIGGDWRLSNLFLFPDLLVSALLALGAFTAEQAMRPILLGGFAMGIGVFSAAAAGYVVDGRFGVGATSALVTCVVAGTWLLLDLTSGRLR